MYDDPPARLRSETEQRARGHFYQLSAAALFGYTKRASSKVS